MLALAHDGAAHATADELTKSLHLPEPIVTHSGYHNLHERLQTQQNNTGFTLEVANRLWSAKDFPPLPAYITQTEDTYQAGVETVDFTQPAAAAGIINTWVAQRTHDQIKNLVGAGDLTGARLVLTNAIYFKGDWDTPFKEAATTDAKFSITVDRQVKTKLMHRMDYFGYAAVTPKDGPAFQALEMDYAGHDLAMLILLPAAGDLNKFESILDAGLIDSVVQQLSHEEVQVAFPRFKMEDSFELNKALQGVGIVSAFTDRADFSGLSAKEGLFISAALHKAYVEVNEKGTQAAAVTGEMLPSAARPAPPVEFTADHPFIFIIRDKGSGGILFLGRVMDPTK